MNISLNNSNYNLHIIDENNYNVYEPFLSNTFICNKDYISKSYEKLSYESLELDGYYGFFLTDITNKQIFVSTIIDIECSQIKENLNTIDTSNSVEIVLLCANYAFQIPGLTQSFFRLLINNYIPKYKPNIKTLLLKVAEGSDNNSRAYNFYSKIGFTLINKNIMKYNYKIGGKRKRKTNKKYKKHRKSRKHRK